MAGGKIWARSATLILTVISTKGGEIQRGEFGPANYNLLTKEEVKSFFKVIKEALPKDVVLENMGVGMPGIGDQKAKDVRNTILKSYVKYFLRIKQWRL